MGVCAESVRNKTTTGSMDHDKNKDRGRERGKEKRRQAGRVVRKGIQRESAVER